jgi:hypothetical protein
MLIREQQPLEALLEAVPCRGREWAAIGGRGWALATRGTKRSARTATYRSCFVPRPCVRVNDHSAHDGGENNSSCSTRRCRVCSASIRDRPSQLSEPATASAGAGRSQVEIVANCGRLMEQILEQTEGNRAQLSALKPNKHRHFHLSDTPLRALGAGRSQVQIPSPRLTKALEINSFG